MHLLAFVSALGKHWWALMSSAVFTFLGIYIAARQESNDWAVRASFVGALCLFIVASYLAWRDKYADLEKLKTQLKALSDSRDGPILVIEVPRPQLGPVVAKDEQFMLVKNVGLRAATSVKIQPATRGPYRMVFEEINAIAPANKSPVTCHTYKGDDLFSSSKTASYPSQGMTHAFRNVDGSDLPLTITYRDGVVERSTIQVLHWDGRAVSVTTA